MLKIAQKFVWTLIIAAGVFWSHQVQAADCQNAGYSKGFYVQSCDGDYKLKMNVQLQPQFQTLGMKNQADVTTFQMRRGRLIFSGHAFNPDLTFKFQYEAIGGRDSTTRENEGRANSLRDAYINYKFNDAFQIRAGQSKPFFNREELTSSSKFQFVALSMANEVFTFARDLGLWVHGKAFDGKLEYGLNVTNEGVARNTINANNDYVFGGRLVYNVLGSHGYTMADVGHSEEAKLALGAAVQYNKPSANADATTISATGDAAMMYKGFSLVTAGYLTRDTTNSATLYGLSGQAGYFIVPERFEIAARMAGIFVPQGNTNGYEYTGGLNYFFKGHNLKIQADYSLLKNSALAFGGATAPGNINGSALTAIGFNAGQTDHRFRMQAQFYF